MKKYIFLTLNNNSAEKIFIRKIIRLSKKVEWGMVSNSLKNPCSIVLGCLWKYMEVLIPGHKLVFNIENLNHVSRRTLCH